MAEEAQWLKVAQSQDAAMSASESGFFLIERVGLAINAVCFMGCEDGKDGFRACSPEFCECRKAAIAATKIVWNEALEAAANVAIAKGDRLEIHSTRIAEEIRKLAKAK
jgi:hypothetical protein